MPKILMSIQILMSDPNPDDSLVPDVAALLKNNPKKYEANAKAWTKKHAMGAAAVEEAKEDEADAKPAAKEDEKKEADKKEDAPAPAAKKEEPKSADDVTLKPSTVKKTET